MSLAPVKSHRRAADEADAEWANLGDHRLNVGKAAGQRLHVGPPGLSSCFVWPTGSGRRAEQSIHQVLRFRR